MKNWSSLTCRQVAGSACSRLALSQTASSAGGWTMVPRITGILGTKKRKICGVLGVFLLDSTQNLGLYGGVSALEKISR